MSSPDADPPSLYAAREPIFPRAVHGTFRRLKWIIMAVTLGIYYITPWIRWDRGPGMPDQAVLVDLANRRFFFFWIEIWPHEFYFVSGLLVMAGLGLFLFTSALGRVWCGNACPQKAITTDDRGIRVVDTDKCIGCGACHDACPWHMPTVNPETGKSSKCIACGACVAGCPSGALSIVDWDAVTSAAQAAYLDL